MTALATKLQVRNSGRKRVVTAAIGLLVLLGQPATGQLQTEGNGQSGAQQPVTAESIDKLLQQAEQSQDLDEETKSKISEIGQQALEELKRAAALAAAQTRYAEDAQQAQERLNAIKSQAAVLPAEPEASQLRSQSLSKLKQLFPELQPTLPDREGKLTELSLPELKQLLPQLESVLTALKKELADLEAEPAKRSERRKELRELLVSAPQKLAEIEKELQLPPPANEASLLTEAGKKLLKARQYALSQAVEAYRAELALYDAEEAVDLVREKRRLVDRRVRLLTEQVNVLRDLISRRERAEAEDLLKQARRQASQANPRLQDLARYNEQLAEEAKAITERMQQATARLQEIEQRRDQTRAQFKQSRDRVDRVGLTESVGLMLRKERTDLPNISQHQRNMRQRQELLRDYQARLFELEDERDALKELDAEVSRIVAGSGTGLTAQQREELAQDARTLLETQQELLDTLIRYYNSYTDDLVKLDSAERELVKEARDYRHFIDERVLWIQSTDPLEPSDFATAPRALIWLTRPGTWAGAAGRVWGDVLMNPLGYLAMLVLLGLLGLYQPQFRRELRTVGDQAGRSSCHDFSYTVRALMLTFLIAVFWPALAAWGAWRSAAAADLAAGANEEEFLKAVAFGLWAAVLVAVPLNLIRAVCRSKGLGSAHFGWAEAGVRLLRRYSRFFLIFGLPLVFVAASMQAQNQERWQDSAGRLAFMAVLVLLAFCLQQLLRPGGPLLKELVDRGPGSWTYRLRWFWYPLIVLVPLALAGLAASGFYYTSWQLVERLVATGWVLMVILLVRAVLLRWQLVNHRKLAFAEVRERLASMTESAGQEAAAGETLALPAEEPGHDLATISSQTRRLLNASVIAVSAVGLWLVWIDVLPALGILDRVTIWHTTVQSSEPVTPVAAAPGGPVAADTEEAPTEFRTIEQRVPITLADLSIALLVLGLTILAAYNVPGLLEIGLLRHLPLDHSVRFAITSLASYVIVIVGILVASNAIGIGWSEVQWLAAALTFGLAFGLQEIFANFVSGLIILFERPIRVGDIVTIENVTGTVSRIRIRATTITNWDKQEFIVPNKEFITGRLLNWTLTDAVNRITITVGIAYGSDTDKARELLAQITREHPIVLDDPAPLITFEQFGDSTLNFVLRAYLPNLQNRLAAIHDLHTAIHSKFAEAGIEIAFPQRDLHVRSGVLGVRETGANGAAEPADRPTEAKGHVEQKPHAEGTVAAHPAPHEAGSRPRYGAG